MFEEKNFKKKYKIQKRKLKEKEKRGENYKNRALECIFFAKRKNYPKYFPF